jgi:hypothetical protein
MYFIDEIIGFAEANELRELRNPQNLPYSHRLYRQQ